MSLFNNAIIGASGQQGYNISRSVRLRSSASAYFNRTNASSPTNAIKWTWSGWVKRGSLGAQQNLVGATNSGSDDTYFNFNSSDQIVLGSYTGAGTDYGIKTSAVFRDPCAWYHVVAVLDTANATSADRAIIYVNGVRQTVTNSANGMWPQNATNNKINTASQVVNIGRRSLGDSYLDGYLTEINFIDGQALTPTSFGQFNSVTGVWQPLKYTGTYGTNGFYLNFSDNSAATAAAIGKDYSGNGNNWTPNNISVTSGVTYDSMLDVPTPYADGGNGRGNYAVLNPVNLKNTAAAISDANLTVKNVSAAQHAPFMATVNLPSKHYWEIYTTGDTGTRNAVGIANNLNNATTEPVGFLTGQAALFIGGGGVAYYKNQSSADAFTVSWASGNIMHCAYDESTGKFWIGQNGVWYNSTGGTTGDPATGANPTTTFTAGTAAFFPAGSVYNQGTNSVLNYNFGQRPFAYTPPSGFKALNTQNLPTPTISNGALYMAATLWTGDATSSRAINNGTNNNIGTTFKPDLVWTKARSGASNLSHLLVDSVRGATATLSSDQTAAEYTLSTGVTAFNSNGFQIGTWPNVSGSAEVGWQWQAGAGTTSSNTSGSITSTVSVNATAGFSIVTYTGNSTANASVGHGLGVAPNMVIIKARTAGSVENWPVYHSSLSAGQFLFLNTTNAVQAADGTFNSSTPVSSTVFQFGSPVNTRTNSSSYAYVAYCFSAVAGYSAFGKYTGNGSSDGPFVYCGFRPRWVLIKETGNANSWELLDTSRDTYNVATLRLFPNDSLAEVSTANTLDILSNGFKPRVGNTGVNRSGGTYIFAAFAENPFKYSLAR